MNPSLDATASGVALVDVTRSFGDHVVLDRFSLAVPAGEVTALMGPNGSGKTTVARLILGLDSPLTGVVTGLHGLSRAAVFQEDRLCRHLSAVGNVRLVLPRERWDGAARDLVDVGLDSRSLALPVRELSGGQRRRVAIVRALAPGADLIVLDEPFTGLDARAKPRILDFVRERLGRAAVVFVTHDHADAAFFGARVVHLR